MSNQISMQMKKYLFFLLIIGLIVTSYSCTNDKDEVTAEEDKEMLMGLSTEVIGDLDEMAGCEGMNGLMALMDLMEIQDPLFAPPQKSTAAKRYRELLFPLLGKKSSEKSAGVTGFGFGEKVGTYTWNAEHQGWHIQQNNPPDKIVIVYPTGGPASQDNNATLTLHELSSQAFEDQWDTWEQPTRLRADLFVDDVKEIEVDLSVSYDLEGEPLEADIYVMIAAFEFSISFEDTGSMFKVAGSLKFDDKDIVSADLKASYVVEIDDRWGDESKELTFLEGYIQFRALKISSTVNIAALEEIDEVNVDDLNANVNLVLERHPRGGKIADVVFVEVVEGDPETIEPMLVFRDGSTALARDFFQPVIEELEAWVQQMIEDFAGE